MAEQNPMRNYEETLKRYREQQARLNSLTGQEDTSLSDIADMASSDLEKAKLAGQIKKVSENENIPFSLQDPNTKDADSVISQYLMGKIKGNETTGRNYRQENIEANDKLSDSESIRQAMLKRDGNNPSDWTTMEGEAYNPNTSQQRFNVDKSKLDYSPLQAIGFDPQELIQNSVKGAKEASNIQIPLAPNQNDVVQDRAAASVPTQSPTQDLSNKVSTTDKTKISSSSTKGGKVPPATETKEVDPLEQFKELMKLQDERTKADKDALAEALKQRDMNAALGMITSGLSKAGAAYGGGGLTQLKGDTSIEQSLNQTADQKIADIKERMKGASEAEKDVLSKQLTLAQMQKMRDDKANEKEKLRIERDKLGLERDKLGLEQRKVNADIAKKKEILSLTKAQEAADKQYGKNYEKWANAGGRETLLEKVRELDEIEKELKKGDVWTSGPIAGNLPRIINPKAAAMKDRVDSLIVDTLKPTLGTAFTEKENKLIRDLKYDPTMEQSYNIPKIQQLRKELMNKINANDKLAQHYESYGTISNLKSVSEEKESQPISSEQTKAPYGNEVSRNGKVYIWNPSVGKYQIK